MPNRLSGEKSPYLLQHANNPVDWYPWGEEAFQKARDEDKPVFLSIGYATCHWCHVMERESFEDPEVARLLNEKVVSIKVDREERPDIDGIYMTVCQALTGGGGWPLSIFMTPDRKPFFAGTYFPKFSRLNTIGFTDIIHHVATLWKSHRDNVMKMSEEITGAIRPAARKGEAELNQGTLETAYRQLSRSFDPTWGGFGNAPKFPTPHHLTFLLRYTLRRPESDALAMVEKTLDAMRTGGIFDQVGFGFARYSVDERWLVPHFEKMLYDQALLIMAYTEAFQATGDQRHARVVREVLEYVLRDMTDPEGGFYSAEDADAEGEEGKFTVWTPEEVKAVLGDEDGEVFCRFYDISPSGNFEDGKSIPRIVRPLSMVARDLKMSEEELEALLEEYRQKIFAAREERVHPLKDDKILTAWNGLMIAALAKAAQALDDPAYAQAASRAADFILQKMRDDSGRLYRRYRQGETAHLAFSEDYTFFAWGLIELYGATFETRYLEEAVALSRQTIERFWDDEGAGLFVTAEDAEPLIVRDMDIYDGAIPSSNSVAALNFLRLSRMTGDPSWEDKATRLMRRFSGVVSDFPNAYTQFLNALDFALGPSQEIVISGDADTPETREMVKTVQQPFRPNRTLVLRDKDDFEISRIAPYVENFGGRDGKPAAHICENFACRQPITGLDELKSALGS